MNIKRLQQKRNEGGFTLIELLIVIVILGILAAIVVFAVGGVTDRGKASACKSDLKTFQVANEAFYAKQSAYPAVMSDLWTTAAATFMRAPDNAATAVVDGAAGVNSTYAAPGGYTVTYDKVAHSFAVTTPAAGCSAL